MNKILSLRSPPSDVRIEARLFPQPRAGKNHLKPNLPQRARAAKSNPWNEHASPTLFDTMGVHPGPSTLVRSALEQYQLTDRPLIEIAKQHACTVSSLMYWAAKLRLPGRKRGRRALQAPTPEQRQMIRLFSLYGAGEAARRSCKSRQRIYQVVERWAPELMMQPRLRRMRHLPPSGHRARRRVVIGFRITDDEMRRLQAAVPPSGGTSLSANAKVRAVVLTYIALPPDTGPKKGRIPPYQPEKPTAIARSAPNRE